MQTTIEENIRSRAFYWWGGLDSNTRTLYAKEWLRSHGQDFKYNNDGFIIGINFTAIIEMFNEYN